MCYTVAEQAERRRRAGDCGRRMTKMEQTVEQKYPRAFHGCRPQHALWDDFSVRHPKMPLERRAKIFSPFDALRGFDLAIEDKLRLYVDKRELSEEEQQRLNEALTRLCALTRSRRTARDRPVRASVTRRLRLPRLLRDGVRHGPEGRSPADADDPDRGQDG